MHPAEGVVKYREEYTRGAPLAVAGIKELMVWRNLLFDLGLVGQDPERYDGAGFGNASARTRPYDRPKGGRSFVITGTQTGRLQRLAPEHFTVVERYDVTRNLVQVVGPVHASSEALTHGAIYDHSPNVRWVFHSHAPEIWRHRDALAIPSTRAEVPYGTPEMALEVWRLFAETDLKVLRILAMAGHEDGIITFGGSAAEAGARMVDYLARARMISG
jgi:hypothetical protein